MCELGLAAAPLCRAAGHHLRQGAEAAVLGLPAAHWGESAKAMEVPCAGGTVSEQDVIAFCALHLARYKTPASVTFAESLPKNAAGKVMKAALR